MLSPRPRILSIAFDISVFDSRNRVLEFAGFDVVPCFHGHRAMDRFQSENVDAVVIGHSVPTRIRLRLLRAMKRSNPRIPVIMVLEPGNYGEDAIEADAVCDSLDSPEILIETVSRLIGFPLRSVHVISARAATAS